MKISLEKARELKTKLQNNAKIRRGYSRPKAYTYTKEIKSLIVRALDVGITAEIKYLRSVHRDPNIDMSTARDMQAAYARQQHLKVPRWTQWKE